MTALPLYWTLHRMFGVESGLMAAGALLALAWPRLGDGSFRRVTRQMEALARRPAASLIVIGLAPIVLRALLLLMMPAPVPGAHDEFSYLLASDTFARGRLVNPPHPMWQYFESFHILQQPVYASMYPPAQGMFLAAGQVLTGHPWLGVWLSIGLFCAALLWMLRGYFPPGWAFLGASLAVIRIGVFSYWMNSYWGGAVGALGGALAAGALPRLWNRPRVRDAALMGLGFVILVSSRPYEGLLFGLPIGAALAWRAVRRRQFALPAFAALAAVLALGVAFTLYYNWRVTGDPWMPGEQLNRTQYAVFPILVMQHVRPQPVYRHAVMRDFYSLWEAEYAYEGGSARDYLRYAYERAVVVFIFYLGPLLLVPLLCAPQVLWSRKLRVLAAAGLLVAAGTMLEKWPLNPHYCSPATCTIYAFAVAAMRRVRHWRRVGLTLVRMVPVICLVMAGWRVVLPALGMTVVDGMAWYDSVTGNTDRARVARMLESRPGKTLAIVRYAAGHNPEQEWVYNRADIDGAKVVWAREMDAGDQALIDYFHDRQAVVVTPDQNPIRIAPYAPPGASSVLP